MQYMKAKFIAIALISSVSTPAFTHDRDGDGSRIIDRLDSDGDSQISLEEFQPPEGAPGGRMLERADLDGDGQITLEEMRQARTQRMAERKKEMEARASKMQERMEKMFSKIDADGDGAVTREEIRVNVFNRMDKNDDGFLSTSELKDAKHHKRMRRQHNRERQHGDT
jgi:EF-hand domain pair